MTAKSAIEPEIIMRQAAAPTEGAYEALLQQKTPDDPGIGGYQSS
jgi:hypothetical protein